MSTPLPPAEFTGVSLGSRHWWACDLEPSGGVRHRLAALTGYSPPSLLLPRYVGEPLRFDAWHPTHPRGCGGSGTLESAVQPTGGVGRFPLAAAWSGRRVPDAAWGWDSIPEEPAQVEPIDAVAAACRSVVARYGRSKTAVVIPNDFQQSEQQRTLDEINQVHPATQLLWLPVAAALAWLEGFRRHEWADMAQRTLGELVVVHCDWGQLQCSRLELRSVERRNAVPVVPARRRPVVADNTVCGFGWTLVESGGELASHWGRVFASDLSRPLESLFGDGIAYQSHPRSEWLQRLNGWSVPQQPVAAAVEELVGYLEDLPVALFGVVVVGDFADLVARELGRAVQSRRIHVLEPVAVYSGAEGERLLAHGAALHLARQAADEVSYYDSLPELELFVDRRGAYEWVSLLGDAEHFVRGGVPWELEEPIVGFELRRGSSQVKLVLAHEEYRGVRELVSSFEESHEQRTPVTLHVSCTPAQGNAKLRLVTSPPPGEKCREVLANWRRMVTKTDAQDQPVGKDEYLRSQPRAFPELMPRLSSEDKWRLARPRLQELVRRVEEEGTARVLAERRWLIDDVKSRLMQKDQQKYPQDATAVGSDFRAPLESQQDELQCGAECLLDIWRAHKSDSSIGVPLVVRALGYLSVNSREFEEWLVSSGVSYGRDAQAIEHTCGLTLRQPEYVARFLNQIFASPEASPGANRLKAVSQILRYRSDATAELPSTKATEIIETCLRLFSLGVERRASSFAFRWSCLIIVYLLRRRMFDPGFLDPSSDLAVRAKRLFSEAIQKCRSGQLRPLRGSVNLPAAFEQMISYIDRKGSGDILMAAEDD